MACCGLWRGAGLRKQQRCVSPQDSLPTRLHTASRLRIAMQPPSSAGLQFVCNATPGRHPHQRRQHHRKHDSILLAADDWASPARRGHQQQLRKRNGFPPPASESQGQCRFTCVSRLPSANSELSLSSNMKVREPSHQRITASPAKEEGWARLLPVGQRVLLHRTIPAANRLSLLAHYSLLKSALRLRLPPPACSISPMTYHINHVSPSVSPLLLVTLQPAPSPSDARIPVLKTKTAEDGQPQRP